MPISNVTFPVGREAMLTCIVEDLGSYKVSITWKMFICILLFDIFFNSNHIRTIILNKQWMKLSSKRIQSILHVHRRYHIWKRFQTALFFYFLFSISSANIFWVGLYKDGNRNILFSKSTRVLYFVARKRFLLDCNEFCNTHPQRRHSNTYTYTFGVYQWRKKKGENSTVSCGKSFSDFKINSFKCGKTCDISKLNMWAVQQIQCWMVHATAET